MNRAGVAAIALGILVAGFFVGRAIGSADDEPGNLPSQISTREEVVVTPAIGRDAQIPPLKTATATTTATATEPETEGEGSEPVSEGSEETPLPDLDPDPGPEVTVAPSE